MNYQSDFDKRFNRTRNGIRGIWILVIIIIVSVIAFNVSVAAKAKSAGKNIYTITVYNFGVKNGDTYVTDSIISQDANKIVFIDAFGRKQMVSGTGITVTQY
jgi:hypothetical protein